MAELEREDVAAHMSNWVPLGFDPDHDPYPDTHAAARGFLTELARMVGSTANLHF